MNITLHYRFRCILLDSPQRIVSLTTRTLNQTSILVSWNLLETSSIYSNLTFSIYYLGSSLNRSLVNITNDLSYTITGLVSNTNYTVRVELRIPFSTQTISATKYHILEQTVLAQTTGPLTDNTNPLLIVIVVIVLAFIGLILIAVVVICYVLKNSSDDNFDSPQFSTYQSGQGVRNNEYNLTDLSENKNKINSSATKLSTAF